MIIARPFVDADAEKLRDLFLAVFAETYTNPLFYAPTSIAQAHRDSTFVTYLALDDITGRLIAALILCPHDPIEMYASIEIIMSDPESSPTQRAKGMLEVLRLFYTSLADLRGQFGISAILSLETVAHQKTQRLSTNSGFIPCGLFLGWLPPRASRTSRDAPAAEAGKPQFRASYTVTCLAMNAPRHPVRRFLPAAFRSLLQRIYEDFSITIVEDVVAPSTARTTTRTIVNRETGRSFVHVEVPGRDDTPLIAAVDALPPEGREMIHVFLPLSAVPVDSQIDLLLAQGFIFGALLPTGIDCDILILQRVPRDLVMVEPARLVSEVPRDVYRIFAAGDGAPESAAVAPVSADAT